MLVRVYFGFQPRVWCAVACDEEGCPTDGGRVIMRAPTLTLQPLWAMAVDHRIRRECLERRERGSFYHLQHAWAIGWLIAVNHEYPHRVGGDCERVTYKHDDGVFRLDGLPAFALQEADTAWFEPGTGVGGRMWVQGARAGEQIAYSEPGEVQSCCSQPA